MIRQTVHRLRHLVCTVTLVVCAAAAQADGFAAPPLIYMQHGVNCVPQEGRIVSGQDTVDGEVIVRRSASPPVLVPTSTVPAKVGLALMIAFRVAKDAPAGTLRASVTHPPMGPQNTTRQTWQIDIAGGQNKAFGYAIEDSFEEVPGPWTFALDLEGTRVLERTFVVVPPEDAPDVMARCFPDVVPGS